MVWSLRSQRTAMADYVEPPNFGDIKKNADPVNVLKKRKVTEKTAATRAAHAAEVIPKPRIFAGYLHPTFTCTGEEEEATEEVRGL